MAEEQTNPQIQEFEKTLVVKNKQGIHARPAAMIVKTANKYEAEVYVEKDGEQVNGKSIMGLMMLAAANGTQLKFVAVGEQIVVLEKGKVVEVGTHSSLLMAKGHYSHLWNTQHDFIPEQETLLQEPQPAGG